MSRLTAPAADQTLDLALEQVEEWLEAPLRAWVDAGHHTVDADGVPVVRDFLERYQGEYDSFEDFYWGWIESTDYFDGWPDEARRSFHFERFARDAAPSWAVARREDGGGVYVYAIA